MSLINQEIEKLMEIQQAILNFLDKDDRDVNDSNNLIQFLDEKDISENPYFLKDFIRLISKISSNHHKTQFFWEKIDFILIHFQKEIKENFSDSTIFNIFKNNKRILYFLFNNNVLIMNNDLFQILNNEYQDDQSNLVYFMKEIRPFIDRYSFSDLKNRYPAISDFDSESFDQKRKIGENEDYISQLIRNDSIVEFITYINQKNISLHNEKIKLSIFETNCFLTKLEEYSLIEYAAFFGSIQIFKYLHINGVELSSSLWLFAIHGRNSEMINFLEENHIQPEDTTYKRCMEESIKCHHNEIINYIKENYYKPENYTNVYLKNLNVFNFVYLSENNPNDLDDSQILSHFCRCGCLSIVNHFIDDSKINFNSQIIIEKEKTKNYKYEIETTTKKYIASPIHFAVQKKNIELVTLLLKRSDLDINLKGRFITNTITEAAEPESEEIDKEETALSIAIRKSDMKIIKLLLKRKDIDINQKLNYLEKKESVEDCCTYVGSELVKSECVIKIQQSVIHIAICNNKYDIIKLLLTNQNIDIQSQYICEERYWDDWGLGNSSENKDTPIELAKKYRCSEIIALLKNYYRPKILQTDLLLSKS